MLHNIGHFTGKKGYHKQSYRIIMNGDHLHGYSAEEIKLIALLARHHRKKLPKLDHSSFKEIPKEVNILLQSFCTDLSERYASGKEVMYVYFCIFFGLFSGIARMYSNAGVANNLSRFLEFWTPAIDMMDYLQVFSGLEDRNLLSSTMLPSTESENTAEDLRQELEYFKKSLSSEDNIARLCFDIKSVPFELPSTNHNCALQCLNFQWPVLHLRMTKLLIDQWRQHALKCLNFQVPTTIVQKNFSRVLREGKL
ncbi:hypothetical protein L484_012755 [Morus notabilis]|uniref:Ppx/GppA phosphatase C-terminal domain-containing protein n=1 Tax=Morus notabilis TaxID=981085 RepID=W9RVM4_9ROSA|nr:hypothetical protein L484_012755 [Morus notabilis]